MAEILTNKDSLFKYGFCVLRNLLDYKEIEEYKSEIKKICEKNNIHGSNCLYNYRKTWEYIVNDRLLNVLNNLLGSNVFYMHDSSIMHYKNISPHASPLGSWHRDNPCRIYGKGPDWDQDEPYKVVSAITYLSSHRETGSGINVIPSSHKEGYGHTFSNILRILHYRTKNKNIKFLQVLRTMLI